MIKLFLFFSLLFIFSCDAFKKECHNSAFNPPECNLCPPGRIYLDGQCALQIAPECPKGKIYIRGECVIHGYGTEMDEP